jgi:hypothetical protein
MKRYIATIPAMGLLVLLAAWPTRAQNNPNCTDALIQGTYGFTVEGQKLGPQGTATGPLRGVAMTTFDGKGSLTQIDTITVNGQLTSDFTHPAASGTYRVNPDCTGTFTVNFTDGRPPVTTNFVVDTGGFEIDTVVIPSSGTTGVLAVRSIGKRRFLGPLGP